MSRIIPLHSSGGIASHYHGLWNLGERVLSVSPSRFLHLRFEDCLRGEFAARVQHVIYLLTSEESIRSFATGDAWFQKSGGVFDFQSKHNKTGLLELENAQIKIRSGLTYARLYGSTAMWSVSNLNSKGLRNSLPPEDVFKTEWTRKWTCAHGEKSFHRPLRSSSHTVVLTHRRSLSASQRVRPWVSTLWTFTWQTQCGIW